MAITAAMRKKMLVGGVGAIVLAGVLFVFISGKRMRSFVDDTQRQYQTQEAGGKGGAKTPDAGTGAEAAASAAVTTNAAETMVGRTSEGGTVAAVLPRDIASANAPTETEEQPKVSVGTNSPEQRVMIQPVPPLNAEANAPPVPRSLIEQTTPMGAASLAGAPNIPRTDGSKRSRFSNRSSEVLQDNPVVVESSDAKDFDLSQFAPEGENIDLALMENVMSSTLELDVSAAVWYPFYFRGNRLLQVGDKVIGKASPGKKKDRLIVNWKKIILKDGRSVPLTAISTDVDGTLGVKGQVVGNVFKQAAGPVLVEFVRGFGEALKQREMTFGYVDAAVGVPVYDVKKDVKDAAIAGGQSAFEKIAALMAAEMEENKPYLLLLAGTRCRARLQAPLDMSQADYGK